jgi:hypothetical protein
MYGPRTTVPQLAEVFRPRSEGGVLAEVVSAAATDRSIIYTVDLAISVDDVLAAANRAAAAAVTAGGYVANEQVNGEHDAVLTLKVPSADHQDTVAELEALGYVARGRDDADRRRNVVSLTARGEAALSELDAEVDAAQAELLAPLAPAERDELSRLLAKVLQRA